MITDILVFDKNHISWFSVLFDDVGVAIGGIWSTSGRNIVFIRLLRWIKWEETCKKIIYLALWWLFNTYMMNYIVSLLFLNEDRPTLHKSTVWITSQKWYLKDLLGPYPDPKVNIIWHNWSLCDSFFIWIL